MCKVIIDGETVEFEGPALTYVTLRPYRKTARHVVIGDSVTEIGNDAFFEFTKLTSVEIPDSVKRIRSYVFVGCEAIESIIIPNSITKIGGKAFSRCKSLSIEIPESVVNIGIKAFWGCNNIKINAKKETFPVLISNEALKGRIGQIITVVIEGDEYPILTYQYAVKFESMVITSFVDYADGKLYSGYEFDGELDSQGKVSLYCYCDASHCFYKPTLSELKTLLEKEGIR